MAGNVPVFVSSNYPNSGWNSYMMIGSTYYMPPGPPIGAAWWFVVISLTDLSVVVNEVTQDGTTIPADVQQYVGNPNYFLFFTGCNMWGGYFPQSPLYDMLVKVGATNQMQWMEAVVEQTGTGYFINFSYILAATMAGNDAPGFEVFADYARSTLIFEFMPITIGGQTIYTPIAAPAGGTNTTGVLAKDAPAALAVPAK